MRWVITGVASNFPLIPKTFAEEFGGPRNANGREAREGLPGRPVFRERSQPASADSFCQPAQSYVQSL